MTATALTATEVLDRIRAKDYNFDSTYTTKAVTEFSLMTVDEYRLFNDLNHAERLKYSDIIIKYPILNIWRKTWMYVYELEQWILIGLVHPLNAKLSQNPEFVRVGDKYVLDIDNEILYCTYQPALPLTTEQTIGD